MMKTLGLYLFFILHLQVGAEEVPVGSAPGGAPTGSASKLETPYGRVKSTTGVNTESSSFIGDPDNIDPLNANRDNIKEDEEPVLEDIKKILDPPKEVVPEVIKPSPPPPPPKKKKPKYNPDSPDFKLEKKFNSIYRKYNIKPTSDEAWTMASKNQEAKKYVVQKGDTLWTISKILFGESNFWPKLWALNKQGILNPHFIKPNTNIYFFVGSDEFAPTLSVGEPNITEMSENNEKAHEVVVQSENPGKIPDSLPLSRNEEYFGKENKREIKIDLGQFPVIPTEYISDIYITDEKIKSEVKIQISEISKFRCYEGRLVKDIKYMGQLVEDYDLFEPLDSFKTPSGIKHAYRVYGKAQPYQQKYLKLTDCKSLITTDLVVIPKDKILTLKSNKMTSSPKARIIGGPNVVAQKLFLINQVAYVDFGGFEYSVGQEYKMQSRVTDKINATIKIIDKYGSLAVVVVTEVDDLLEIGDKVITE